MKKWLPLLLKMLKNYLVRNVQQNIAFVIMGVQIFIPLFLQSIKKRGVRVVEGASLESLYVGNCIVGSNPILSANFKTNFLGLIWNDFELDFLSFLKSFRQEFFPLHKNRLISLKFHFQQSFLKPCHYKK